MGTNIKKRRSEQEYDPQTGRYGYRDESGAFHHNRYSFKPKKGYVVDPDTPQPVGRDAYYWYDKSDKPVNCNVTRKNLRDVDALFKFLAGFCIAAICLVWIHRQIETRSISQTEVLDMENHHEIRHDLLAYEEEDSYWMDDDDYEDEIIGYECLACGHIHNENPMDGCNKCLSYSVDAMYG